jgi:hypothetical protein
MPTPAPIYTVENCRPAFQLNWSLTLFWKEPVQSDEWFPELKDATEKDHVRL